MITEEKKKRLKYLLDEMLNNPKYSYKSVTIESSPSSATFTIRFDIDDLITPTNT